MNDFLKAFEYALHYRFAGTIISYAKHNEDIKFALDALLAMAED